MFSVPILNYRIQPVVFCSNLTWLDHVLALKAARSNQLTAESDALQKNAA